MATIILGIPNHSVQGYAQISTPNPALEPSDMLPAKLGNEEPSEKSRILTLDPRYTQWKIGTKEMSLDNILGAAIVGHNIPKGGQFRVIFSLTDPLFHTQARLAPNGLASPINITGGVSNVDEEISSVDGAIIEPTDKTLAWLVRFTFPNLSSIGDLNLTEYGSAFVIRMQRKFNAAGETDPLTYPMVSCSLHEGGSLIANLGNRAVIDSTEAQILIFPFSLSSLADPTGTNIEVEISCTPGVSGSGNSYGVLDTVSLYYENNPAGQDSGWITVSGDDRPSPDIPTRSHHYLPVGGVMDNITCVYLYVRSDNTNHNPPISNLGGFQSVPIGSVTGYGLPETPQNWVDVGVFNWGEGIRFKYGIKRDQLWPTIFVQEIAERSLGGQQYVADSFRGRQFQNIDLKVTESELTIIQDQLAWRRGHSGAIYLVLNDKLSDERQVFTSAWVVLTEIGGPVEIGHDEDKEMVFTISISGEEKL